MTSLASRGRFDYQISKAGSARGCWRGDVKNLGEEFWEDGAVKQQRPSAKSLEVKGTEGGRGRPRGSEVIGTSKQARPAENDSNLAERGTTGREENGVG